MKRFKSITAVFISAVLAVGLVVSAFAWAGNIPEQIISDSTEIANKIEAEGTVLLKNDGSVLPLKSKKVNIFGVGSVAPYIGGTGSGAVTTLDYTDFYEGLDMAGVNYNADLKQAYEDWFAPKRVPTTSNTVVNNALQFILQKHVLEEMPVTDIPSDILSKAKKFSDTAVIVISRAGSEHEDYSREQICLSEEEQRTVDYVANNYKKVIVVFNTSNIMQMDFLNNYPSIKAAVIVGIPGEVGFEAVGKILKGDLNPSGRLADTIAFSIDDHPSEQNFGSYKYEGTNTDSYFVEYEEGIFVGYRYFETFAPEKVMYPFGYGLSYTNFSQQLVSYSANKDTVKIKVKVTNTGKVSGKDVVEAYYCPPYTAGGIEKSVINLAGFEKTKELAPGKSQTVEITFDTRSMSSYDMNSGAWVLEKGDYVIKVGKNIREFAGQFVYSNPSDAVYTTDDATGNEIKNRFDFSTGREIYLSRSNPNSTYPTSPTDFSAPANSDETDKRPAPLSGEAPKQGVENDPVIMLADVYEDESLWDEFLDQMTVDEMIHLTMDGCYHTVEIERLGVPATVDNDGPAQVKGIGGVAYTVSGLCYPAESVLGCTWNKELAREFGERVGTEAENIGTDVWYAPGFNIHRNPRQGRNFEYYSEDPLLSGILGAETVKGVQNHGVAVTIKHFTVNEQETHRSDNGLFIWVNEQALREIYLKPFEIVVKTAEPWGVMSSYSRIGIQWCGSCPALLKEVLRGEWGFDGYVVSDYWSNFGGSGYMDPALAVYSGNDLLLSGLSLLTTLPGEGAMMNVYKSDPVGFGMALREASKNILKMKMRTNAFKRMTEPANADEEKPTEEGSSQNNASPNTTPSQANTSGNNSGTGTNNGIPGSNNPSSGGVENYGIISPFIIIVSCFMFGTVIILLRKRIKE
ncbi:MAG: glycoside hydrolase family 3 C-terminal domain-containing protein [Clostridia bacterium]|nr:glycoside hydrolase family 3 C-terminal domain-containing protein [Clostridia bacterium]